MSEKDETAGWQEMPEFADVDLTRSFVLSWHVETDALLIDIDLFLAPEHPFYEKPRPAEKVCIRPAIIEFPFCEALVSDSGSKGQPADIAGNLDHGALSGLRRVSDTRYEITGEFGTVLVEAESPVLRLKQP